MINKCGERIGSCWLACGFVRVLNNGGKPNLTSSAPNIQTFIGQIRPFSDHFTQKSLNSDLIGSTAKYTHQAKVHAEHYSI